jgi:Fis family transcriptional regulator
MTFPGASTAAAADQTGTAASDHVCLSSSVKAAVETYFADLNGHMPGNLYEMVMAEVERPLLETVMREVQGNQTRAAKMLGINRSTLRKKLAHYGLNT